MEIRVSPSISLSGQTPNGNKNNRLFVHSVIEMNTFLVTLIRQFEFFLPENGQEVRGMSARPGGVLAPIVVGEEDKGPQMPLKVTALRNE